MTAGAPLLAQAERHAGKTALETVEPAKQRGGLDIAVNVMRILAVGLVQRIDPDANFALLARGALANASRN
jgi:hypothetical protein